MGKTGRRGEGAGVGEALGSSEQPRFTPQYRPLSMSTASAATLLLSVSSAREQESLGSPPTTLGFPPQNHRGALSRARVQPITLLPRPRAQDQLISKDPALSVRGL